MCKHFCTLKRYAFREWKNPFCTCKKHSFCTFNEHTAYKYKITCFVHVKNIHFVVEIKMRYVQRFLNLKSKISLCVHAKRYTFSSCKNFIHFTYATSIFFAYVKNSLAAKYPFCTYINIIIAHIIKNVKSYSVYYIES